MRIPEQEKQWQEVVESVAHWLYYRDWDREFTLHFPSGEWFDERIEEYIKDRYRKEANSLLSSAIPMAVVDGKQELPVSPSYEPLRKATSTASKGMWSAYCHGQQVMKDDHWVKIITK